MRLDRVRHRDEDRRTDTQVPTIAPCLASAPRPTIRHLKDHSMNSTTRDTIKHFRTMARASKDEAERDRLLNVADGIEADANAPTDPDVLADKRLYGRLQQEMETRDRLADFQPLSQLIGALAAKPQYVDGRWVMT